ncbi:MAG: hypothetical protein AAFV85_23065 [Cyanobacteria bacterium J06634_6]
MSITLQELRDRVATALAPELGTKTFMNARGREEAVTALTIDDGNVKTVGGKQWEQKPIKNTGLECVIEPEVDSNIRPLLGGDFYLTHTTRITLKQFDVTATTKTARSLLIQGLGNLIDNIGPRIKRNSDLDSVEQQSFLIIQNASS